MNKLAILFAAVLASLSAIGYAASSKEISPHALGERSVFSDRAIAERIRPAGTVCVTGEECGVVAEEVVADAGPRSGQQVYETACAACHATGAAGAPRLGDASAWAARLSDKGRSALVANTVSGIGAMPAMGMCMDCDEDEIAAAVDYILEQSR